MPAPTVAVTINSSVVAQVKQQDYTLSRALNARDTASIMLRQQRVTLNHTIVLHVNSVAVFGGLIRKTSEAGSPRGYNYYTRVAASSWEIYCDETWVSRSYAAGTTLATIVADLLGTALSGTGITAGTVPSITFTEPLTYTRTAVSEIFNDLSTRSSLAWGITPGKVLNWEAIGTTTAPFNITDATTTLVDDVVVEQDMSEYANRVIIVGGSDKQAWVSDTVWGDGASRVFYLNYPAMTSPMPLYYGGVGHLVGT